LPSPPFPVTGHHSANRASSNHGSGVGRTAAGESPEGDEDAHTRFPGHAGSSPSASPRDRSPRPGSPDFVPPAERIAAFDNDGTLWAEQPMYFQLLFALHRVAALAPRHPESKDEEPFASLLEGDVKRALAGGERAIERSSWRRTQA
jgi:hypothetical protein